MGKRILHIAVLAVIFPCILNMVAYYGFGKNIVEKRFDEAGFTHNYENGIYKYRVLGRYLLLKTNALIRSDNAPARIFRRLFARAPASLKILDPEADATFYAAYFAQNTFFMVLASIVLCLILPDPSTSASSTMTIMMAVLLIGVTQFVVTPYDTLSVWLLLSSFYLIANPLRFGFPLLILTLVAGALTRESAAVTLSYYFAWHHRDLMSFKRGEIGRLALLTSAYLATYSLLRGYYGVDNALWHNVRLTKNFTQSYSLVGIVALLAVAYLLISGSRNSRKIWFFLVATSPYVASVLVVAQPWELRLWLPVWLGLICLAPGRPGDSRSPAST